MEYRRLGASGLEVPVLSFGAGTFGGSGPLFGAWGDTDAREARRLVDICLEAGITMFDTADVYSAGASEEVLGAAIKGRRDQVILSTKTGLPMGDGPGEAGTSRARLITACEDALRRLGTDHIDLFQLHAFDAGTPVEEVLSALDDLVRAGKVRYPGISNFSGWQAMKSLATAERRGYPRYVAHQVYYSLVGRLRVGADAARPRPRARSRRLEPAGLGAAHRPDPPRPAPAARSRLHRTADYGPPVDDELLYRVTDALDEIAEETGKAVPQIALNWLLRRPTVSSVIVGARTEEQLRQNLGAVGWTLDPEHMAKLDAASAKAAPYPYFPYQRQEGFARLNPSPVRAVPPAAA